MKAEVVAIGTELLLGDIVNGNAAWLGQALAELGVDVEQMAVVGDNVARIAEVLGAATRRADVVVATGGLGPTQDDLTREALAELAGVPLERDPEIEAALRARYAALGRADFPPMNLRMADRPHGAVPLPNPAGTAPGLRMTVGNAVIFALPGVPGEMREIFRRWVAPELAERAGPGTVLLSRVLRTIGVWESEVADALADLDAELALRGNPTLAYLASEGQTRVRISAKAANRDLAAAMIAEVEERARIALGDAVYGADSDTIEAVVHRLLTDASATVATAESLTGGLVGAALTETPGASDVYRGGVIGYTAAAKVELLGLAPELIAARGVVDPEVAVAMAESIRNRLAATYGVATTGVAGPARQDGKPVGTVYVAVAAEGGPTVREVHLSGDRQRIRRQAVNIALDLLRRRLLNLPPEPQLRRRRS